MARMVMVDEPATVGQSSGLKLPESRDRHHDAKVLEEDLWTPYLHTRRLA